MAIDTALKRASALNVGSPWRGILPLPDGTVAAADRQVVALHYSGILAGAAVPPDPETGSGSVHSQGGGRTSGGFYIKTKRRLKALVDEWVDVSLREMYEETKSQPAARKEAASIVRPFAEGKAPIPAPAKVDWEALAADAERVRRLIELWSRQERKKLEDEIEREDEMILFGIRR